MEACLYLQVLREQMWKQVGHPGALPAIVLGDQNLGAGGPCCRLLPRALGPACWAWAVHEHCYGTWGWKSKNGRNSSQLGAYYPFY